MIVSGAQQINNLQWTPYKGGPILSASVALPDERMEAWLAAKAAGDPTASFAAPPPVVASLFVNGVRQVRAR